MSSTLVCPHVSCVGMLGAVRYDSVHIVSKTGLVHRYGPVRRIMISSIGNVNHDVGLCNKIIDM